jgi:pimeloyl-ACP methyl ester carboxylesterase
MDAHATGALAAPDLGTVEQAVQLGDARRLVGVVTRAATSEAERPPLVLLSSGIIHRVGPNRLYVQLAREAARHGHDALRFDLAGIGDSGPPRCTVLAESVRDDITDSLDFMGERTGVDRFIVTGLCSGADNAFAAALRDPRIVGIVLLDPSTFKTVGFHLRRLAARIRSPASWRTLASRDSVLLAPVRGAVRRMQGDASEESLPGKPAFYGMSTMSRPEVRAGLEELVARGVRMLYVFTGGLRHRYNYAGQLRDAFPGLDFRDLLRVEYLSEADHTLSRAVHRRRLLEVLGSWLDEGGWPDATPPAR